MLGVRQVVLCVLLGVISGKPHQGNFPVQQCHFDSTPDNGKKGLLDNSLNGDLLKYRQITKADTIHNVDINAAVINEMQINAVNNIVDSKIKTTIHTHCLLLNAEKINTTVIEGKYLSGVHLKTVEGVEDVHVTGTNLHSLSLTSSLNTNHSDIIALNNFTAETIDGIHGSGSMIYYNYLKAHYINNVYMDGHTVDDNEINSEYGIFNVRMNGEKHVYGTKIRSLDIVGVSLESRKKINGTLIAGVINAADVNITTAKSVNNTEIVAGNFIKTIVIKSNIVEKVNITASVIENVFITGNNTIRDIDITSTKYIRNININGTQADVRNVHINGVPVDATYKSYLMQCADQYGFPLNDPELGKRKECFTEYCETICTAKGFKLGSCHYRTCCCFTVTNTDTKSQK